MCKYSQSVTHSLSEVDSVVRELLDCVDPKLRHLEVNLDESLGKYLGEDIRSQVFIPPIATSAMDGYAVRLSSLASVSYTHLTLPTKA